jgi:imidazolonepropionase-like amidohydrolase
LEHLTKSNYPSNLTLIGLMKVPSFIYIAALTSLMSISVSRAGAQTYIQHVSVIDVIHHRVLPEQTVVIRGEQIASITPSGQTKVRRGSIVINARGQYLLPGLTDAHVHFTQSGGLYSRPDFFDLRSFHPYQQEIEWGHQHMGELLRRYLRAGITTVIDPGANYSYLQQRNAFKQSNAAPAIYMANRLITTFVPAEYKDLREKDQFFDLITGKDQAAEIVQKQLRYHPDFIKIWYIVDSKSPEESAKKLYPLVKAVITEAHLHHVRVAVHAPERIAAQFSVEAGCDFLVHGVNDEVVTSELIQLIKAHHVVVCPTLQVMAGYAQTMRHNNHFSSYELKYADPGQIGSLTDWNQFTGTAVLNRNRSDPGTDAYFARMDSLGKVNLKKISDAGVIIAAGTDAGNTGTMHATSLFTELEAMHQTGMSNWQVLESATINGAKAVAKDYNFGSITPGKEANLVLLNDNPVASLENLKKIRMVFNRGHLILPDTLIKDTPITLIQRQINGYNFKNSDAYVEPCDTHVTIYNAAGHIISGSKDELRKTAVAEFGSHPDLHRQLISHTREGDFMITQQALFKNNKKISEQMVKYEILHNRINRIYLL